MKIEVEGSLGGVASIGSLDVQAENAQGLALSAGVLSQQSADATHPGLVNNAAQTLGSGIKTFSSALLHADGTLGAPGISFSADTDTGVYRVGANDISIVAGGHAGLDIKDNATYANVGMGGAASASSNYPLLAQRDLSGVVNFQVANPNADAGSGAKWQLSASSGNNGFEVGLFSPATSAPDAYNGGNATIRSTGTTAGIAYVADDSGAYHKFYVAGNGSANEYARISTGGLALLNSGAFTGAGTGLTGTAASLTAGHVTTNANLTGPITSSGNATSIASQTGTGTKFVVDNGPTLIAPLLGTPASGVLTNCTGTASGLTAGTVTTNANMTGDVTSSGNATTYAGTVPLNKGGTGQTTKAAAFDALQPMTTGGDLIYGGASGTGTRLANGSVNQYLASAGTTAAPVWTSFVAPTVQKFTSGTSQTYTTPTSPRTPLYLHVRLCGGGGGGGGSATNAANDGGTGGTGGTTSFGTSMLSSVGGSGGAKFAVGTAGTASLGTGPIGTASTGNTGSVGVIGNTIAFPTPGGEGAAGMFGGAAAGGDNGANGGAAGANNSGAGGGGAGAASGGISGAGGSSSGFIDAYITSPAATYTYSVGAAGTAGTAGTGGAAGGAGGSGYIEVTEHYQ